MFHGKRVVVTGASGVVGSALVEAFLALGGHVMAVARRRTGLDDVRAAMRHHDRLRTAECDVADAEGVGAFFDALDRTGGVDAIVHAAGAFAHGALTDIADADVARLIDTNVRGTAHVLRHALRSMAARGGAVVVIAADARAPSADRALFGATQAAVEHLVAAAAADAARRAVRVNAILTGMLDTPERRCAHAGADTSSWVRPEAVARAAVWLAGSDGAQVTGALVRLPSAEAGYPWRQQ